MSAGDFLSTEWAQLTRGVYDAADNQIGYYVDLPTLAAGHVMLFQGQTLGDPWNWKIKAAFQDLTFSQDVNAGQYLVQKGFSPAWMTAQEVAAMRGTSGPAGVGDTIAAVAANPLGLPNSLSAGVNIQQLALYGGLGLLGLLVVKKVLK